MRRRGQKKHSKGQRVAGIWGSEISGSVGICDYGGFPGCLIEIASGIIGVCPNFHDSIDLLRLTRGSEGLEDEPV